MADPECEEDAEKYFVINSKQLIENGLSHDAKLIRFYLTQESKIWKNFYLADMNFIKDSYNSNDGIGSVNKYIPNLNNSRFEFEIEKINFIFTKEESNKNSIEKINNHITILNDNEEINQKYIEIMKINNSSNLNFTIFK